MKITRNNSQNSVDVTDANFTGRVRLDPLFMEAEDDSRTTGASVTFEPGSRTDWHTHPIGQTLIITSGAGLVGTEDGEVKSVSPGDVVWFPAGEKHWHGAAPEKAMTHIAIQEEQDGSAVDWLESVSDDEYQA